MTALTFTVCSSRAASQHNYLYLDSSCLESSSLIACVDRTFQTSLELEELVEGVGPLSPPAYVISSRQPHGSWLHQPSAKVTLIHPYSGQVASLVCLHYVTSTAPSFREF
ncbi:hypothetical protein RRG08_029320 [Elysia crispata]|uniref:Uncharacterized protein n=1 Tax=Elysia crispata TaxID=231223 RepID=A0AAE1ARQ8_9GAST|nr:hypothetical protein RRG08_029320 [Elysia crispata]